MTDDYSQSDQQASAAGSIPAAPARGAAGGLALLVNGEPLSLPANATVADLLKTLGLAQRPVAVEVNLNLIPRGRHSRTPIADGDRVEIVTLVGGG